MSSPLYTTDILRLAASLGGPHELEREDGCAKLHSPTCGSEVSITVQLDEERRVEHLSMHVRACAFGQASAALVEKHGRGRSHEEVSQAMLSLSRWLADAPEQDESWPGIAVLEPARSRRGRHGAILLPFRTLLAAIEAAK